MSYYLTPEADTELTEAVAFYAERVSLTVARNFLRKFEETAAPLAEFPGLGTPTTQGGSSSR